MNAPGLTAEADLTGPNKDADFKGDAARPVNTALFVNTFGMDTMVVEIILLLR